MRRSLLVLALAVPLISQPGLFDSFWNLLSSVWAESAPDAGCIADPSGRCAPTPDEGCIADPSGRCAPTSDGGCIADPDGRCAASPRLQADEGCIADPDGRPRCSS